MRPSGSPREESRHVQPVSEPEEHPGPPGRDSPSGHGDKQVSLRPKGQGPEQVGARARLTALPHGKA
eukprot:1964929-Alexandrium_andersonii.AAC.1